MSQPVTPFDSTHCRGDEVPLRCVTCFLGLANEIKVGCILSGRSPDESRDDCSRRMFMAANSPDQMISC